MATIIRTGIEIATINASFQLIINMNTRAEVIFVTDQTISRRFHVTRSPTL
jgi:hypothetical protein